MSRREARDNVKYYKPHTGFHFFILFSPFPSSRSRQSQGHSVGCRWHHACQVRLRLMNSMAEANPAQVTFYHCGCTCLNFPHSCEIQRSKDLFNQLCMECLLYYPAVRYSNNHSYPISNHISSYLSTCMYELFVFLLCFSTMHWPSPYPDWRCWCVSPCERQVGEGRGL